MLKWVFIFLIIAIIAGVLGLPLTLAPNAAQRNV